MSCSTSKTSEPFDSDSRFQGDDDLTGQILAFGRRQQGEQRVQNPVHNAMVERSGWFDVSPESRVFLPRRSSDGNHAAANARVATIAASQRADWRQPQAPVAVMTDCLKHLFGVEFSLFR